ncbi:unnamed protein product [Ceutorhynchus assimilis]|uniref:SRR1-like domain-containing protein n=1 Tax=Ceutorhynchus assimilis TaxID=467358 RepID=A0A9N9MDZ8_9CUCU|nr:unnamed protein product [Ceutorhynchus assimilis]
MSLNSNNQQEFIKVVHKRKGKLKNKIKNEMLLPVRECNKQFDLSKHTRRVSEAKQELLSTDIFQSVSALLKEALTHLDNPKVGKIITLGLGQITDLTVPRYQLALLLCLQDLLEAKIIAFDPIFNENDKELLTNFGIKVENLNVEAKHKVNTETILFYLPHCPKQLTNNLLWSNWGLNLSKCIIIGNSISKIIEDDLGILVKYVDKICPYVLELNIVNNFKIFEVFNDTSIHIFPMDKLKFLSQDFWEEHQEPQYSDSDIEFVRQNKLVL